LTESTVGGHAAHVAAATASAHAHRTAAHATHAATAAPLSAGEVIASDPAGNGQQHNLESDFFHHVNYKAFAARRKPK
jgi:hypothetical protein